MTGAISVLVVIALLLACAGIVTDDIYRILHDSPRAPLPRRAGHARHAASPVAAPDEAGPLAVPPAGPAGLAAAALQAGDAAARPLPLAVETPALYNTGAMPRLNEHTEGRRSE